jgi:hypothetical protein
LNLRQTYYLLIAVDASGLESGYSNEAADDLMVLRPSQRAPREGLFFGLPSLMQESRARGFYFARNTVLDSEHELSIGHYFVFSERFDDLRTAGRIGVS